MTYPLTSQGVSDLISALYALPNNLLEAEANAIKNDFAKWVTNHFSLNAAQKIYLNKIPNRAVTFYGDQCWFCFINRLNVSLVYTETIVTQPSQIGKYNGGKSTASLTVSEDGDTTATGEFVFTIEYRKFN